ALEGVTRAWGEALLPPVDVWDALHGIPLSRHVVVLDAPPPGAAGAAAHALVRTMLNRLTCQPMTLQRQPQQGEGAGEGAVAGGIATGGAGGGGVTIAQSPAGGEPSGSSAATGTGTSDGSPAVTRPGVSRSCVTVRPVPLAQVIYLCSLDSP